MSIDYTSSNSDDLFEELTRMPETPEGKAGTSDSRNEESAKSIRKVYSHHSLAELVSTPAPIEYLVDGYIQKAATHMVFGDPGSYKSFNAVDMALSIACEEIDSWCNRQIEHGSVIYMAGEGVKGLGKRCEAWLMDHNVNPENIPFAIIDECFHLNDEKNPDYSIENTIENIRAIFDKPALIVVDTLNRFYEGNENDSKDMSNFIHACDRLIREFGCAVLIIHHTGNAQDSKNRGRGSSSLKGALEIEFKAEKKDNQLHLTQTKNKDSRLMPTLVFDCEEVTLPPEWNKKNGEPETSLALHYSPESTKTAEKEQKTPKLTDAQSRARKTFRKAIRSYGIRIHDEQTGHYLAGVYIGDWREEAYHSDTADNDNTKRSHFHEDRKYLKDKAGILIKRTIEGREYYCLDMQAEGEDLFRTAIITELKQHEQETAAAGKAIRQTENDAQEPQENKRIA